MLYYTLTENQMPFTCSCAYTDAQHKGLWRVHFWERFCILH